jgi:hypothetical protein
VDYCSVVANYSSRFLSNTKVKAAGAEWRNEASSSTLQQGAIGMAAGFSNVVADCGWDCVAVGGLLLVLVKIEV